MATLLHVHLQGHPIQNPSRPGSLGPTRHGLSRDSLQRNDAKTGLWRQPTAAMHSIRERAGDAAAFSASGLSISDSVYITGCSPLPGCWSPYLPLLHAPEKLVKYPSPCFPSFCWLLWPLAWLSRVPSRSEKFLIPTGFTNATSLIGQPNGPRDRRYRVTRYCPCGSVSSSPI